MSEQWITEAENSARNLAEILLKQIINEADDLCVDREWFYEKVLQYMKAESENINMADIELVIKIPKEAFELLQTNEVDWLGAEHILDAVANGTPLLEHYRTLIDAKVACPNHTECVMCPIAIGCSICAAHTIIPATKEKGCEDCNN